MQTHRTTVGRLAMGRDAERSTVDETVAPIHYFEVYPCS